MSHFWENAILGFLPYKALATISGKITKQSAIQCDLEYKYPQFLSSPYSRLSNKRAARLFVFENFFLPSQSY